MKITNKNIIEGLVGTGNIKKAIENSDESKQVDLTSAIGMPITYKDIPIGFITNVNDHAMSFNLWAYNMNIILDEDDTICRIELCDKTPKILSIEDIFGESEDNK